MERVTRFLLRFPPELHQALKRQAEREHRTLHAHIMYLLSRAVEPDPAPPGATVD